jgi:hypothetical protein
MALQPFVVHWPPFEFLNVYTVGRIPRRTGEQPVARPLPIQRIKETQNKRTRTSMPRVEFEPTTPVFERAKTVHASDRAATMISPDNSTYKPNVCLSVLDSAVPIGLIFGATTAMLPCAVPLPDVISVLLPPLLLTSSTWRAVLP